MLSKAKQSKAKQSKAKQSLNFKLFQKLCLYNNYKILFYLCIKNLFKFFFVGNFDCGKSKNSFINIKKFNRKNIFKSFGKSFNNLYKEFLRQKIIKLFEFFIYFSRIYKKNSFFWYLSYMSIGERYWLYVII